MSRFVTRHGQRVPLVARLVIVWAAVMLISTALLVDAARRERERLYTFIENDALSTVELLAREDEQLLERSRVLLEVLSSVPAVASGDAAACNSFLWKSLTEQPAYFTLGVANPQGQIICSSHRGGIGIQIGDREDFREALEEKTFAAGEYRFDRTTGEAAIHFSQPILDEQGQVIRVVFAALDLQWLDGFAQRVQLPAGSQILAWDEDGTVLAAYPREEAWVGKTVSQEPFAQRSFAADRGTLRVRGPGGEAMIFAFTGLSAGGMLPPLHLGIAVPREAMVAASEQSLRSHLYVLWGTGGLGALALLGGAYLWLIRPLRRLEGAATLIADGDLGARAPPQVSGGEVGRVSAAFNEMAESIDKNNADREEFIGLAAHELKTPLTTLKLHLQRALQRVGRQDRAVPAELADMLVAAERQTWRLAQLVETILDARSLSMEPPRLDLSRFDLADVVREVCRRMESSFRASDVRLVMALDAPVVGVWDRALVERMLGQVLSNAAKFGQSGPVVVSLREEFSEVVLSVQDFGIGISREDQLRIFGRFERAVSSRHHGGLGLGLWVARELAHRLGGEIELESAPGLGATFAIRLPRNRAESVFEAERHDAGASPLH